MKTLTQLWYLYLRGFKQSIRPYPSMIPELLMPIFFFLVNSAAFQRAVEIPGFGGESYLQFYAPVSLLTVIFLSSGSTGLELVTDISTGYMSRLFLTPISRMMIIVSKLLAVGTKAVVQTIIMIVLLLLFGAQLDGGIVGLLLVIVLAFIFSLGWSGIGMTLAFITKNPRVVQSAFIFFFPFSMMTTAQLPLHLLEGWYKVVVQLNPVTYILEAIRAIVMTGTIDRIYMEGLLAAVCFSAVTIAASTITYRRITRA
ncbi:MAG: hypothetical protein A2666_04575 [Parcubacteria group bacterium RIFCSPHIGHO2_01_FULL_47_10b]|nr:MAG: hypothetical protein A2666_04575 [Parcubacteria group bacterium RIFCSPHIGHO2_01_FULL_47_10b]